MLFASAMTDNLGHLRSASVYADICTNVASSFYAGRVDVAVVLDVMDNRRKLDGHIVHELPIDFAWASARTFKRPYGQPIPISVWPADNFVLDTLNATECNYQVICTTSDYLSKLVAVETGSCVAVVPRGSIGETLIEANLEELPRIASKTVLVAARGGKEDPLASMIISP